MNLSTVKVSTNTYEIEEAFTNISVDTDTADVVFALSENGRSRVTCDEEKKLYYSVSVQDGTLRIDRVDERRWYDYIRIFDFHSKKITVYLPQSEYAALSVRGSTGNVAIHLSTGDTTLTGVRCKNLITEGDTGKLTMTDVIAAERFEIERETGDVRFEACDAAELDIETDTGDVKISIYNR